MRKEFEPRFALVVPTLNEAGNIRRLLREVQDALEPTGISYELIVVDDDSTDQTPEIVRAYAVDHPQIRLISRRNEKGLAGAVVRGWRTSNAAWIGVIDADLQHPPSLLPELLGAMEAGNDIAIASRYAEKNGVEGWNPIRVAISRVSTWATLPFQRRQIRVKDPMSGFFMLRRSAIEGLVFEPRGFKLLLEILVRGKIHSVVEIPFQFGRRHAGKSKAGTAVAIHFLQLLGKLSRHLILRPTPQ
jgi:dolichol-phosphate mannosyltransferase